VSISCPFVYTVAVTQTPLLTLGERPHNLISDEKSYSLVGAGNEKNCFSWYKLIVFNNDDNGKDSSAPATLATLPLIYIHDIPIPTKKQMFPCIINFTSPLSWVYINGNLPFFHPISNPTLTCQSPPRSGFKHLFFVLLRGTE